MMPVFTNAIGVEKEDRKNRANHKKSCNVLIKKDKFDQCPLLDL
jgi:hypothetical protein